MSYYQPRDIEGRMAHAAELENADLMPERSPHPPKRDPLTLYQLETYSERFVRQTRTAEYDTVLYQMLVDAHLRLRTDNEFASAFYARSSLHAGTIAPLEAGSAANEDSTVRVQIDEIDLNLGGRQFALHNKHNGYIRTGIIVERPRFAMIATPLSLNDAHALAVVLGADDSSNIPLLLIRPAFLRHDGSYNFERALKAFSDSY